MLNVSQHTEILERLQYDLDRIHDAQLFAKEHPEQIIAYVDEIYATNTYTMDLEAALEIAKKDK
jgi:hypothetical protein